LDIIKIQLKSNVKIADACNYVLRSGNDDITNFFKLWYFQPCWISQDSFKIPSPHIFYGLIKMKNRQTTLFSEIYNRYFWNIQISPDSRI